MEAFVEFLAESGFVFIKAEGHVDVLGALAGEHEYYLFIIGCNEVFIIIEFKGVEKFLCI